MTKKDYVLIARAINFTRFELRQHLSNKEMGAGVDRVVEELVKELQNENPRFNRSKFIEACGLNPVEDEFMNPE